MVVLTTTSTCGNKNLVKYNGKSFERSMKREPSHATVWLLVETIGPLSLSHPSLLSLTLIRTINIVESNPEWERFNLTSFQVGIHPPSRQNLSKW